MASWACLGCRTVYAVGIPACPHCGDTGYSEDNGGGAVAKASAEGGGTLYVAEGQPVPGDVPDGVRLVGPGAPAAAEPEPEAEAVPGPPAEDLTPPASSPGSSAPDDEDGPPDYAAYRVTDLRDLARERGLSPAGAKADLVAQLTAYDAGHPEG